LDHEATQSRGDGRPLPPDGANRPAAELPPCRLPAKSFTPGCTIKAHEFAEAFDSFAAAGASLLGISSDTIETQREFSTKECRDKFPVGTDPSLWVIKAYDAGFNLPILGTGFAELNFVRYRAGRQDSLFLCRFKHIENTLALVTKRDEHKR
jgi:hypothetical protein